MSKRSAVLASLCIGAVAAALLGGLLAAQAPPVSAQAPTSGLPPGPMQEKARVACLGCHTAAIIVQQQLDRRVWTKEMDKMIRWGAPVAAENREALIDYFAQQFGPRPEAPVETRLPPGAGADKVRAACLGCHDAGVIAQQQLDRRGWATVVNMMSRWGAPVRAADREAILNYLARHFAPLATATKKEKQP